MVEFAARQADDVYAFVTPVYGEGVTLGGQDRTNVEAQLAFAEGVCRRLLRERCMSTQSFNNRREMYANLTHLGIRGHDIFGSEMASWLSSGPSRLQGGEAAGR